MLHQTMHSDNQTFKTAEVPTQKKQKKKKNNVKTNIFKRERASITKKQIIYQRKKVIKHQKDAHSFQSTKIK